jgi:hypothetical protein
MATDEARYDSTGTLPADRAFVIHFRMVARHGRRFIGRVEHLASGAAAEFRSLRGLLAFLTGLLEANARPVTGEGGCRIDDSAEHPLPHTQLNRKGGTER